jgi:ribosomal protein L29
MPRTSYKGKSKEDLIKSLLDKRKVIQDFRFGSAGSKTRDVKVARNARKDVARIMTELNRPDNGQKLENRKS